MRDRTLTKNRFTTESYAATEDENIVFISYRRTACDQYEAQKCARILERIAGLHYWLDEDDECMQQAQAEKDDVKTALCIEKGLDVSSALLGIIGPGTFNSPWIPYEIGGARGRQRYEKPFDTLPSEPHPLIAHFIHRADIITEVPAFVALGTPLTGIDEVEKWAQSIANILQKRDRLLRAYEARSIQDQYEIQDIYKKNAKLLKPTPRY